jgi:hypothetical protein
VKNRMLQIDDVPMIGSVVFDFGLAASVNVEVMRIEVTVGDAVLVHVLRGQCRRERQQRRDEKQRDGASRAPVHFFAGGATLML